jgi:hypothetical protein
MVDLVCRIVRVFKPVDSEKTWCFEMSCGHQLILSLNQRSRPSAGGSWPCPQCNYEASREPTDV